MGIPKDITAAASLVYDALGRGSASDEATIARALLAERMAEREHLAEMLDASADRFDALAITDDVRIVKAHRAIEKMLRSFADSIRNQDKP